MTETVWDVLATGLELLAWVAMLALGCLIVAVMVRGAWRSLWRLKRDRLPVLPPYEGPRLVGPGDFVRAGQEKRAREAKS